MVGELARAAVGGEVGVEDVQPETVAENGRTWTKESECQLGEECGEDAEGVGLLASRTRWSSSVHCSRWAAAASDVGVKELGRETATTLMEMYHSEHRPELVGERAARPGACRTAQEVGGGGTRTHTGVKGCSPWHRGRSSGRRLEKGVHGH
jgi:hypothetical protein